MAEKLEEDEGKKKAEHRQSGRGGQKEETEGRIE